MIEGQNLELNQDVAIIWGASEFDLKDTLQTANIKKGYKFYILLLFTFIFKL